MSEEPIKRMNMKTPVMKPVGTDAPAPKSGPVVHEDPVEPDAAALDAAWKEHRRVNGMRGCGTPVERPKGWKP